MSSGFLLRVLTRGLLVVPLLAVSQLSYAGKSIADYVDCVEPGKPGLECPYPYQLEKVDPAFKKSLVAVRKSAKVPNIEGPESPLRPVRIQDRKYLWALRCQVHNCDAHQYVFIYAASSGKISGLYQPDGQAAFFFGQPDEAEQGLLTSLLHK